MTSARGAVCRTAVAASLSERRSSADPAGLFAHRSLSRGPGLEAVEVTRHRVGGEGRRRRRWDASQLARVRGEALVDGQIGATGLRVLSQRVAGEALGGGPERRRGEPRLHAPKNATSLMAGSARAG